MPETGRRNESKEIEITPEMVKAGVEAFNCWDHKMGDVRYLVDLIYSAMREVEIEQHKMDVSCNSLVERP
jgi:hypothetical protein